MNKLALIAVLLLLITPCAHAQSISPQDLEKFQTMEDSMVNTADSMFNAFIPDLRTEYSERFARQLVRTLRIPNSWLYPFPKVGAKINIIAAADNSFRIFNWEITSSETARRYYGAIQLPAENLKLIGLNDYSSEMENGAEDSILTGNRWFGALYYRIISHEVRGRKVYTLFGFNASSQLVNRKLLDPLTIADGKAIFGAPIFAVASKTNPQKRIDRFILEYKKDVQVSMNWDSSKGVIIFDKLVSQMNDPHRKYTFVPSGQYDGFQWGNDSWNYMQDLIPVKILQDGEAPDEEPKK